MNDGFSLSKPLEVYCIVHTINLSKTKRKSDALLIIHSDIGNQSVSKKYRKDAVQLSKESLPMG